MVEFIQTVLFTLNRLDGRSLVDVLIVAGIVYWLLSLIRGTTAEALVRGLFLALGLGSIVGNALNLTMLNWLLRNSIPAMLVAVPILFQPEIRRALEQVGRAGGLLPRAATVSRPERVVEIIASACRRLSECRWGALMVLERDTALGEFAKTGVEIDGLLSVEHLLSVFYPNSPLHDGAAIIRGERVAAAGCVLPLAESMATGHTLGTRHRAAVGITERTDAISIVVSEETGQISIANNGRMVRNLDESKLRKVLSILNRPPTYRGFPWIGGSYARPARPKIDRRPA
ncbi:MAG: TIGR00159 family protein [Chloroflexi bacterium]|nr:TIGR00159 family protein [Chloroflexota bacterium]